MLVKVIMAPIRGGLLLARCFAFIYICFSLDRLLDGHIFPQEEGGLGPGSGQAGVSRGPGGEPWLGLVWTRLREPSANMTQL